MAHDRLVLRAAAEEHVMGKCGLAHGYFLRQYLHDGKDKKTRIGLWFFPILLILFILSDSRFRIAIRRIELKARPVKAWSEAPRAEPQVKVATQFSSALYGRHMGRE
jgi:hypothetical protein